MKPEYKDLLIMYGRLDKELWEKLRNIIYEDGYLCYHDEEGCHYVLCQIVELLKKYQIKKIK